MGYFRDLFKNKDNKLMISIAVIFSLGIFLLVMSEKLPDGEGTIVETSAHTDSSVTSAHTENYELILEKRLEEALCRVDGVGEVKVMITLAAGREIIIRSDETAEESVMSEEDGSGGSREQTQTRHEDKTVFLQKNGEPIVLQEIEPKIEGVIIIAEGGGDVVIRDMLVRACQSLLGIEIHKIQVLKMK